jgi:hypothetical protein
VISWFQKLPSQMGQLVRRYTTESLLDALEAMKQAGQRCDMCLVAPTLLDHEVVGLYTLNSFDP